ncbi:hypothetical protein Abr02nite_32570 [Paractinoplanes brasiliensis]|nr:hypothetical protein Abr02nite_32570 [Actinoplanes brasiliensis]
MAAAYNRGRGLHPRDIERWMTAAGPYLPSAGGRILDMGAGTGRFTNALAWFSTATVVACEPSAAMRDVFRAGSPHAVLVGGAAEALPFRARTFDAVWASQMIHHVRDLPAFAAELRRVLQPNGHLLIRGGFGPPTELPFYRYFPRAWTESKAALVTLDQITGVLSEAGFAVTAHVRVEQTYANSPEELIEKAATRSLSPLADLPDQLFEEGLAALRADAAEGRIAVPVVEQLDLVVLSQPAPPAPAGTTSAPQH